MPLLTFPTPKHDPRFSPPNRFGIPDDIYIGIVTAIQLINQAAIELFDDAPTISANASLGSNFYITLTANIAMNAPINPSDWQVIRFYITQDAVGSRTLSWDSIFRFSTDIPAPTLTTTPEFSDYVEFMYNPTYQTWDCTRVIKGFDTTTPP